MKAEEVTVVRVYLTEASGMLKSLLNYLHDESKVHGVTVFRGITGFGKSGRYHSSTLMDMSLDLPVVIEFFESPDRATAIIRHLSDRVEPGHIVYWNARMNANAAGGEEKGEPAR
jgi:PII-like signaling protein